jgi:hypothetical protein
MYLKSKNFDLVEFVREEMSHPDEKGRVFEPERKMVNVRIEEL